MKENWPVVSITLSSSAPLLPIVLIQVFYFQVTVGLDLAAIVWFLIGVVYVHFVEYTHHRGPMHTRVEISVKGFGWLNKIFGLIWWAHLYKHHRIFSGANFQSNNPEDLKEITGPLWFFSLAFLVHYLVLLVFILTLWLSANSVTFFAVGTVIRYLFYEIPHFFTHKKDNKLDQIIFRIPVWGRRRRGKIKYHKRHHDDTRVNFSVTPPWTLDKACGTYSNPNPV